MRTWLLFEVHHLGDAVLSIPFVRAARESVQLHIICRAASVEIYRKFLPMNQIHPWEPWWESRWLARLTSLRRLITLLKTLRGLRSEQALCVWADSRIHWLMRRSKAEKTLGFPVNKRNFYAHERPWRRRRMRLGQLLGFFAPLTHPLQRRAYQQAHLTDWQQLTEHSGLSWNVETPWFDVSPSEEATRYRQPARKLWLIHPGGRLPTKRWPLDRFQQLLSVYFKDCPAILVRPPDSPALVPQGIHHFSVAPANLEELLALVQAADAVLCNDSLVSHLAAALGKPVWTIFGSGNPRWFAPYGNMDGVIASDVCPCRPCIDRCVYASPVCLEAVTVSQVAENILP